MSYNRGPKLPRCEELILFEDQSLIALNKPAYITTEHDNREGGIGLSELIKHCRPEARIVHRLDFETTGIVLAAKDELAYKALSMAFQYRKIQKVYYALIAGVHKLEEEIDLPIVKLSNNRAAIDKSGGKKAVTRVLTRKVFKGYTLVEARPASGRFHQIRIHMAALGVPLLGDALYGGKPLFLSSLKRNYKTSGSEERPIMARAALHAYSLTFHHPATNEELTKTCEPAADFNNCLRLLEKYASV